MRWTVLYGYLCYVTSLLSHISLLTHRWGRRLLVCCEYDTFPCVIMIHSINIVDYTCRLSAAWVFLVLPLPRPLIEKYLPRIWGAANVQVYHYYNVSPVFVSMTWSLRLWPSIRRISGIAGAWSHLSVRIHYFVVFCSTTRIPGLIFIYSWHCPSGIYRYRPLLSPHYPLRGTNLSHVCGFWPYYDRGKTSHVRSIIMSLSHSLRL